MNSGKNVADGWTGGQVEGSIRGPRGLKNVVVLFNMITTHIGLHYLPLMVLQLYFVSG